MKMRYLFVWEWLNEGSELNNCNTCCIISFFWGGVGVGVGGMILIFMLIFLWGVIQEWSHFFSTYLPFLGGNCIC